MKSFSLTLLFCSISLAQVVGIQTTNTTQINSGAISTVATGVQKVGIADSGGTAFVSAANGLNSTGGGVQAVQVVGQLDDTSPNTCTENQFCNVRISSKGVLYNQIRDAAGNERGANVNASNQLSVSVDNSNVSTNVAQMNGVAVTMGNGVSGTGVQRVAVASDNSAIANWGQGATGSAVPSNAVLIGGKGSGNLTAPIICDNWTAINISTATTTKIIALASSKNTYICSFHLFSAGTTNAAWVSGTKTTNECDTSTAGLAGGTTSGSGYNLIAQTGLSVAGGLSPVIATATTGKDVCIITSGAVQLSGTVSWTQF